MRMRTKPQRRKWCAGSGCVKTFRGGGGRGGRRRSRILGGGGDSGGAGSGTRRAARCRQAGLGRAPTPCPQRRWTPPSGWPGRARTCWGSGCERFRDEHPPLGTGDHLPDSRSLLLVGLPHSPDCFCSSELLPGLCPDLWYSSVCVATKWLFLQSY